MYKEGKEKKNHDGLWSPDILAWSSGSLFSKSIGEKGFLLFHFLLFTYGNLHLILMPQEAKF